jgi:hypothetical protein
MTPRRSAPGPEPYLLAVGLAASVVVVRSLLLALDGLDRLQALTLGDPLWAALGVLLALLLGPYVKEVEAAGTRVITRDAGSSPRDTADELATYAADDPLSALPADQEAELAAGRYLGLELAMAGAVPTFPELDGLRLHLYVPDDAGRLGPVLEHDDADDAWLHGWDPGVGVVGRAFASCRTLAGRGAALRAEGRRQPGKEDAFADLDAVVAVPLLNLSGRPVGVLSAASGGEPDPERPEIREALEALASGLARVLVDLAAWGTDDPGSGAREPTRG